MKICETDPTSPEARAILEQSWRYLRAKFPSEERFHLDVARLRARNVDFFLATEGGMAVGCAAFVRQAEHWGEIKSMYVIPGARGSGIAQGLLEHLEATARLAGCRMLRLETVEDLDVAVDFYARHGFERRATVAGDAMGGDTIFMEKNLAPETDDAASRAG
ncbi:GNAT family N-acetyltransferase [Roseobacter sp. HKCCA0434]|uniref:GNAT family N-acetyltransferase n=1 Tax=Roseobacter sp. HKCCA0434 TaxID=3079297 RepID=UPI002905CDD5|nr:GNAT family N-acetyltransferase [Roseobacter sp. HKCCA0434]